MCVTEWAVMRYVASVNTFQAHSDHRLLQVKSTVNPKYFWVWGSPWHITWLHWSHGFKHITSILCTENAVMLYSTMSLKKKIIQSDDVCVRNMRIVWYLKKNSCKAMFQPNKERKPTGWWWHTHLIPALGRSLSLKSMEWLQNLSWNKIKKKVNQPVKQTNDQMIISIQEGG